MTGQTDTTAGEPQTIAATIAPHLPYLRRYSRALNGSQDSGDRYVAAVLEALIADQSIIDLSLEPRIALFKLFTAVWSSAQDGAGPEDEESGMDTSVLRLTPRGRQLLLLTTLEEFSLGQACQVLDLESGEAALLHSEARDQLATEARARIMIIEDEPIIALDIENILTEMGHEVVGTASTHTAAVELDGRTTPELILADIQLADGSSGIDAVQEILKSRAVPVVFITAFPERLLTGERPEPTYLVTKPFRAETVQTTVGQALFHLRRPGA